MKKKSLALAIVVTGGLAASVHAQLEIVNNVSGTWIEISGTGNMLVLGDDQSVQIFNTVSNPLLPPGGYVNSNGTIGAGMFSAYTNEALPSASFHGGTGLAPLWDDLNPTLGGMVYWQEIGDTLIVQWQDVPFYGSAGEPNTFQVQVFGSGPNYAQFLYQGSMSTSRQRGDSATIGAQQDPSTAAMYSLNQDILTPGTVLTVRMENPNAVGACCFSDGSCQFISRMDCNNGGGAFAGENVTCAAANCPQPGACCFADGSCQFIFESACSAQGGTYAGAQVTCAAANCPQPGACCLEFAPCSIMSQSECLAQGGTYAGNGISCAAANCPPPVAILMPVPSYSHTFSSGALTRGLWFTAPTEFEIRGLRVPDESGHGLQNVEVVRLNVPPPPYAATTNDFVSLARHIGVPSSQIIPVSIAVNAGDIIGILGACGDSSTMRNSYAAESEFQTDILGQPTTLRRLGMQYNLVNTPTTELWTEAANISRVEVYYGDLDPTAVGACCFANGSCQFITRGDCQTGGGTFSGENVTCAAANCQPQVACCFFSSCSMLTAANCTAQGGTALAVGSNCSSGCPTYEFVENLPGVFTNIASTGMFITSGDDSSEPFLSSVTNALITDPNLYASTNGVISSNQFTSYFNTELPAAAAGLALFPFWDDLYVEAGIGSVVHQAVVENGINVHIVQWDNVRLFGNPSNIVGTFQVKIFESGPIIAQYIYEDVSYPGTGSSNGSSATVGVQANGNAGNNLQFSYNTPVIQNGMVLSLILGGGTTPCYANCDGSTVEPVLNVDDFTCFINEFASAQTLPHSQQVTHYANCDGSQTAPALNVDDFTCFINEFAAGCR